MKGDFIKQVLSAVKKNWEHTSVPDNYPLSTSEKNRKIPIWEFASFTIHHFSLPNQDSVNSVSLLLLPSEPM